MRHESLTYLRHLQTDKLVEAALIEGLTIREVELADLAWSPTIEQTKKLLIKNNVPSDKWPQHLHWDWRNKRKKTNFLNYKWFGIKCNGDWQGLLLLELAQHFCQIKEQKGKPLVYLQYLATAPWNTPALVGEPLYSLVGKIFVTVAIEESIQQEFKGRIGLHSLPQSESYYSKVCKMTDLGKDPTADNLRYFEMTEKHAQKFLNKGAKS